LLDRPLASCTALAHRQLRGSSLSTRIAAGHHHLEFIPHTHVHPRHKIGLSFRQPPIHRTDLEQQQATHIYCIVTWAESLRDHELERAREIIKKQGFLSLETDRRADGNHSWSLFFGSLQSSDGLLILAPCKFRLVSKTSIKGLQQIRSTTSCILIISSLTKHEDRNGNRKKKSHVGYDPRLSPSSYT
jgi:hypothetical protein